MLKRTLFMLALVPLAFFVLTACSNVSAQTAEQVHAALSKPFSADAELRWGDDGVAMGALDYSPAQTRFTLEYPEAVSGLMLTLSAEGETLSLSGMEKRFSAGTLPDRAPLKLMNGALAAASSGRAEVSETKGAVKVTGRTEAGAFTLTLEPETLFPRELTMPEADLAVKFSR